MLIFQLLTLDETSIVSLPNPNLTPELSKESLLSYCTTTVEIKNYMPDSSNNNSIDRSFLLMVKKILIFS